MLGKSATRENAVLEQLANSSNLEDLDKLAKEERAKNQEKWKKRVDYGKHCLMEIAYLVNHVPAKMGKYCQSYTKRLQHTIYLAIRTIFDVMIDFCTRVLYMPSIILR